MNNVFMIFCRSFVLIFVTLPPGCSRHRSIGPRGRRLGGRRACISRVSFVRSCSFLVRIDLTKKASHVNTHWAKFPICGNAGGAHCRHGSVHAKATRTISAAAARGNDPARFRPQDWNFVLIAASDGNGRAKCDAQNLRIHSKTVQMPCGRHF